MVISECVRKQLFTPTSPTTTAQEVLIRLPPTTVVQYNSQDADPTHTTSRRRRGSGRRMNLWSVEEHERFLHGLELYPRGPWKEIAAIVGTKTVRQTMTHAQKYRQKIERMVRRDQEHERDDGETPQTPLPDFQEMLAIGQYSPTATEAGMDGDEDGIFDGPLEVFAELTFFDYGAFDPTVQEITFEREDLMGVCAL
jgi:SHAQKYF class myb-like DNA-binding protein